MKLLDTLERRLGRYAIPNVTLGLVFLQGLCLVLALSRGPKAADFFEQLVLMADKVRAGEWWRLFTFVVIPPTLNPLFAFFGLYFFYLMGTALEGYWGEFRYNLYLLTAYVATVAVSWIVPYLPATNGYIMGSVFLAFAWLYPDFVIYLFFIIPIKIKWLALVTWAGFLLTLLVGSPLSKLLMLASVLNFLLFFGRELALRMRTGSRHMKSQAQALTERNKPFHVCAACGITDKSHPKMEFRYCPDCAGTPGYCEAHINAHTHRTAVPGEARTD
jgi:hypothetical protein